MEKLISDGNLLSSLFSTPMTNVVHLKKENETRCENNKHETRMWSHNLMKID